MAGLCPAIFLKVASIGQRRCRLFRRGLAREIDDLIPAVDGRCRRVRILQLGLAVAHGDEIGAGNAELLAEILLDRFGTVLRKVLVEGFASDRIGVAATTKVEFLSAGFDSALPSSCTAGSEAWLIRAELYSNRISRSIFGLAAASSAICSRSPSESERDGRLRP